MNDIKVIEVLKTFDKATLKKLELFVASPFFNTKKEFVELVKYLIKYAPDFTNEKKLNKIAIYRKIFPSKAYQANKAQRFITAFTRLVEQFIAHHQLMGDEMKQKISALQYYQSNNLDDFFSKKQEEFEKYFKDIPIKNNADYWMLYQVSLEKFTFDSNNDVVEVKRSQQLEQTITSLQSFYILRTLELLFLFFSFKNVVKYDGEVAFLEFIQQQALDQKFSNIPMIKAYYNTLMFLKNPNNEDNFKAVKTQLKEERLSPQSIDEKSLYDAAYNYCALQINAGNSAYYQELFDLYKMGLNKDILYVNGYLFPNTVKNMVTTALRLGELEWTENFLNEYKDKLNPEHQEDIYNYNRAHLLFYKKEYDKALEYLEEAHYKDTFFKTDAKKLKVKIFYEQDEVRLLDSYIEQFYMSNYRNELVSEKHQETNRNFILLLKQLVNIPPANKEKLEKLHAKIEQTQKVAERLWLTQKIKEKMK